MEVVPVESGMTAPTDVELRGGMCGGCPKGIVGGKSVGIEGGRPVGVAEVLSDAVVGVMVT
jgi:hypothetical protein